MASQDADIVYLRSYGRGRRDDGHVVRRVLDTTIELLRAEMPYSEITTPAIAAHADVPHAELCMYFRSKNAIVAEAYLELLRTVPLDVDFYKDAPARVADEFFALVMLLADEPALAAACWSALVCDEPSVRVIRQRIHEELRRRVRAALRSDAWPEVAEMLEFGLLGALVQAGCGAATFREKAEELTGVVAAVLPTER